MPEGRNHLMGTHDASKLFIIWIRGGGVKDIDAGGGQSLKRV